MEFKVFLSCTSLVLLSHSVSFLLADITSLCSTSDSYWEVQEGKQDNKFTCTGLSAQDTVVWNRWVSANDTNKENFYAGSCPPPPDVVSQSDCDRPVDKIFVPSRTSSDSAVMLINPTIVDNTRLFDKGRLLCSAVRNVTVKVGTAGCRLDYIYPSENIACTVQLKNDMWAVSAQCTITKAFSAQNRYRCEWLQTKLQDKTVLFIRNTTMSVTNYTGKYVSGSCNFTSDLPSEGQYMYHVNVVPGEVAVNASFIGTNEIRRPTATPTHTCPQYVPESGDLNCTCSVSELGSPPGVLQWNTTGSTKLFRSDIQVLDSGTYVCQLLWNNTLVQSVQYILNVAYGPKNVTPVVISRQPFDTNGSQIISLSCSVSGSNPPANITWIRSNDSSVLCNTQLCEVTPKPPDDDGVKLECQARNPVTNKVSSSSVTISLNYPPTSPPVITGSASLIDSQPVYEGDNISLTCTVPGGKPVNATVITFTCPNKPDTSDYSTDSYSISSSLTLDPVSANNHGICLCTTKWKNYDWYSRTVNWVLKVYTPPSVPLIVPFNTIDTSGRPTYPFVEGTNGTLYCYSNQTGRPEATYTWPVSATGHVSGSNLTFYQLTREDKGRQVTCLASNSYTENKGHVDNASFVLNVYYKPVVTFTLVSDTNNCLQVSNQLAHTQCVVPQGKMVHINCTADSNPAPASFLWLRENKDVFSDTSDLVITSANHTTHNGDFNCTVFTKQEQGDSRLPLISSAVLTVIVGYSPTVVSFTINSSDNTTGIIRENFSVALKCLSNGRPTPSMRLINVGDPARVLNQSQPTGDISAEDQMGEVVFSIEQVPCEFSGVYRCEVNNTLGQDSQSGTLFVFCVPRGNYTIGNPLTITTIGGKGQLTFEMTAYPTPTLMTVTFLGEDVSGRHGESPAKDNIIQASCSATLLAPGTAVCNITVFSITPSDEGYYKAVFNNSLGETAYKFYVKAEGQPKSFAAILGGILASVAVIIAVIAAAILIRRRRVGKGVQHTSRSKEKQTKHKDADKEIIMNSACARSGDTDDFDMTDNALYAGSDGFAVKNSPVVQSVRGDYEDVRIGTASVQAASSTGNEKLNKNEPSQQDSSDNLGNSTNSIARKLTKKQMLQRDSSSAKESNPNIKKTEKSRKKGQKKKKVEASLSMEPLKATDYENVAFEATQTDPADSGSHIQKEKTDSSVQHNKDGLIYLSLAFDKTKSAKPAPPKREETEYVSIDPQKTASFQQHDNVNS